MEVVTAKTYNKNQTLKWERDYEKAKKDGRRYNMPQLAFYLFNPPRKYGYVAYDNNKALWDKSKLGVIKKWEMRK